VQGDSEEKRRYGRRYLLTLSAAYVLTTGLVVLVVSQAAPAVGALVPRQLILLVLAVVSVIGIGIDARAASKGQWTLGMARQTPKYLQFLGEHAWITPYAWGVDTGLMVTTYRVSFCSWLLLLLALIGVAPPWAGLIYGMSFVMPLLLMTRVVKTRFHHPSDGVRPWSAVPIQVGGIGSMLLLALVLLLVTGASGRLWRCSRRRACISG